MNKVMSGDGTSLLFISDASICTNDIRRRISLLLIGAFYSDNTNDQSAAYVAYAYVYAYIESQEKTRLYKFKLQVFPAVLFGMWRVVRITCSACFGRNPFSRLRSLSILRTRFLNASLTR